MALRTVLIVLISIFGAFVGQQSAAADCPSLNMTKGVDYTAQFLISGSTLLFLGKIENEKFIGDISHIYDSDSNDAIDITYQVEEVYKGQAGSTITLRTPFFCEACSISNETELKEALDADIGRRVIVYTFEYMDSDGHQTKVVSGGCPESIDANPFGSGKDLVNALERAIRKSR